MKSRVPYVTPAPWKPLLQHPIYATAETYLIAAEWLRNCATVADWGGGTGYFQTVLPPTVRYLLVDGTIQTPDQVLADLTSYQERSDGILIRHVLDLNAEWRTILRNAMRAFRERMVVITYTPSAGETTYIRHKSGWPIHHFRPSDLVDEMSPHLVSSELIQTSHPERVFLLEKA